MYIFFDLDSTLVTLEGLDYLAQHKQLGAEFTRLTHESMSGALDFAAVFPLRVGLLAPTVAELQWLGEEYLQHITPGVEEVVAALHRQGHVVGIITHNFELPAKIVAAHLGIDPAWIFASTIQHNEQGAFVDYDTSQVLARTKGKRDVLAMLREPMPKERLLMVGDSVGDMATSEVADLFVGFGGVVTHDRVRAEAPAYIMAMEELLEVVGLTCENDDV